MLVSFDPLYSIRLLIVGLGHPKLVDYTATKGAIVAFTRAISNQVIGDGIRVNCVAPGK